MTKKLMQPTPDLRKVPRDQRPPPSTGQSGARIALSYEQLNADERLVLCQLAAPAHPWTITALTAMVFREQDGEPRKHKLRVRNALRRLVRGRVVQRHDRALYQITKTGEALLRVPQEEAPAKPTKLKLVKPAKAPKEKAPKAPKEKPAPEESGATRLKRWRQTARDLDPTLGVDPLKTALVVLASCEGLGNVRIHQITNLSRGFIIARLKRLTEARDAGKMIDISCRDGLLEAIAIATGAAS